MQKILVTKGHCRHSIDALLERQPGRRKFLAAGCQLAAMAALGSRRTYGEEREVVFRSNPFGLGVASGDPLPSGIVLWTRLDTDALTRVSALDTPIPVRWEIAEDDRFRRIVNRGSHIARPELGHSIHAEVEGLRPAREYWYRFIAGGEASPIGRTRTAPGETAARDRLRFAFVSCQHYEQGYFTAYRKLTDEDLDLVIHLGDYIYESAREPGAVRLHQGDEPFTLEQYRARYLQYRTDPDLQAAHAAFPWVVTPDDHEVSDNYAAAISNGMAPEQFLMRRAAAYHAYYEFMPLRRSSIPAGPDIQLFRRLRFGLLAGFHVLDTRQYRSAQPCGDGRKPRCEQALSSTQRMLGREQEQWLMAGLRASPSQWNIVANQVMMAEIAQVVDDTPTFAMDKWDGYVDERTRLMKFFGDTRPSNPVVITGDFHSNWVADLKVDFANPSSAIVATELVGTSISSGGDGSDSTPAGAAVMAANPHMKFYNANRGYVRCTVTAARLIIDYRTLPYVSRPGAPIRTRATFVVENGRPGAQQA
jgi:alkaline phosphatase D